MKFLQWLSGILLLVILIITGLLYTNQIAFIEHSLKARKYLALNEPHYSGVVNLGIQKLEYLFSLLPSPVSVAYTPASTHGTIHVSDDPLSRQLKINRLVPVADSQQLLQALRNAKPGDGIQLHDGEYQINQKIPIRHNGGEPAFPITVFAKHIGNATIWVSSPEGILLGKPHWHFDGVVFKGRCQGATPCEHAIHIAGDADNITISNNQFVNFLAHIKSNGVNNHFPDRVKILNNDFFNTKVMRTSLPVTPIDVVGGHYWLIASNFIADFSKVQGNRQGIAYGAFLKGGGRYGVIENNVINCAWRLPHLSPLDIRIALSIGGGGTGAQYCHDGNCQFEHQFAEINNNLLLNCHNDVALYLNKAADTKVTGNTILGSLGIDGRYSQTTGEITDNRIQGRLLNRQGANIKASNNQWLPVFNNHNLNLDK